MGWVLPKHCNSGWWSWRFVGIPSYKMNRSFTPTVTGFRQAPTYGANVGILTAGPVGYPRDTSISHGFMQVQDPNKYACFERRTASLSGNLPTRIASVAGSQGRQSGRKECNAEFLCQIWGWKQVEMNMYLVIPQDVCCAVRVGVSDGLRIPGQADIW